MRVFFDLYNYSVPTVPSSHKGVNVDPGMNFFQPDAKKLEFIWCLHGNFIPAAVPTCSLAKKDH